MITMRDKWLMSLWMYKCLFGLSLIILLQGGTQAQGNGPRTMLLTPSHMFGVDVQWIRLNQNLVPAGNIYIPGSDITVNVFPITLFYTFSVKGRYAFVFANLVPGSSTGTVNLEQFGLGTKSFSCSGVSDGFIGFKLGLIGAPALRVDAFLKKPPAFSLLFQFRTYYPGTYNADKVLNMGSNRVTLEAAWPMAIPIAIRKPFPYWLEVTPSIEAYTINNHPAPVAAGISQTRQTPLFVCETYLSKNLHSKFWAGIGWRFQYGGTTILDDKLDLDSRMNALGIGAAVGFQAFPTLGFKATYGTLLWGDKSLNAKGFRLIASYTHFNVKKVNQ